MCYAHPILISGPGEKLLTNIQFSFIKYIFRLLKLYKLRHSNRPFTVPCCRRTPGRLRSKVYLNVLIWLLFPFVWIKLFEPPGGDRVFLSDLVPLRIIKFGHFQMIAVDWIKNKFVIGYLYDLVRFLMKIRSVIF